MKKFKKFLSVLCVVGMMISTAVPAFATTKSNVDIETIKQEAAMRAREKVNYDDLSEAEEIVRKTNEIFETLPSLYSGGVYDRGNNMFYTTSLSLYDNASPVQCADIILIGLQQDAEAESLASQVDVDAYRHFSWNYYAVKTNSAENMRIFTCNYEWTTVMFDEIDAYYTEKLNELIIFPNAVLKAKTLAADFALNYRSELISQLRNYPYGFERTFGAAAIQDFWNNNSGRNYGSNWYDSCMDAYVRAYNDGKLTWGDSPSSSIISATFNTKTMWIP